MSESDSPTRETLDQLKAILRTDLRLGDGCEIPDDAPLLGSDLGLDSLDVLLLVSMIEKTCGVQIPNEKIETSAFQSLTTLGRFVESFQTRAFEPTDGS